MPPNTRGSTRPSHSQNLAKPPVQRSHRPRAVTAHDNDHDHDNLSGTQSTADEEPMELFLDLMLGTPILFYVEKDVSNREQIAKLIRVCIPCGNRPPSAVSLTTIRFMVAPFLRRTRPSTTFWVRFARNPSAVAGASVWQDQREQLNVCGHYTDYRSVRVPFPRSRIECEPLQGTTHISSSGKDLEATRNAHHIDACSKPTLILSLPPYSGSHVRGGPQPLHPIPEQEGKGHP
jgi:hypothetical protein